MALRAEIAVIDDDENVVGIVKVPLFKSDARTFDRGPFAENMVTDPDTGEVYKFTFQADVVGQIAPKREDPKAPKVEAGDTVKIVASVNRYGHALKVGSEGKVSRVERGGAILVDGIMEDGHKLDQHVAPEDIVVVEGSTFPKEGDVVRIIGRKSLHAFYVDGLAEVNEVTPAGNVYATGAGRDGKTVTGFIRHDDYILE